MHWCSDLAQCFQSFFLYHFFNLCTFSVLLKLSIPFKQSKKDGMKEIDNKKTISIYMRYVIVIYKCIKNTEIK